MNKESKQTIYFQRQFAKFVNQSTGKQTVNLKSMSHRNTLIGLQKNTAKEFKVQSHVYTWQNISNALGRFKMHLDKCVPKMHKLDDIVEEWEDFIKTNLVAKEIELNNLITTSEAMKMLDYQGEEKNFLRSYSYGKNKKFPFVKMSNTRKFRRSDIENYIKSRLK